MARNDSQGEIENLLNEMTEASETLEEVIETADEYFIVGTTGDTEAIDQAVDALNESILNDFDYIAKPYTDPDTEECAVSVVSESLADAEKETRENINKYLAEFDETG